MFTQLLFAVEPVNNEYVTRMQVVTSAGTFKRGVNRMTLIFSYLDLTPRRAVHLLGDFEFVVEVRLYT